jgi:hypothetical protein
MTTKFQASLSQSDINDILNVAEMKWRSANKNVIKISFKWKNKTLISHQSNLQLFVDEPNGVPVCKRFHNEFNSFMDKYG